MAIFNNKKKVPEIPMNPSIYDENKEQRQEFPHPTPNSMNNQPNQHQTNTGIPHQKPVQIPSPEITQQTSPQPSITGQAPQINNMNQNNEPVPVVTPELHTNEIPLHKEQPFFVRIDKFKETKENFEQIYIKIKEMETILQSLEQTKEQEEKEIDEWKNDIQQMKTLLNSIDREVFSKI